MEEGIEPTKKKIDLEGQVDAALQTATTQLPSTEFVKVEKNLASLGFFTPSSKRTRDEKSKTVTVTVLIDGKRIEAKATIAPTALFGLPITADQDKWLALHKILADVQTRDGKVMNPVSFSSAELLALLKIYKDSGKNYRDVSDWLDVMVGTTIISEGAVYFGGKRVFGKDTFHVFDRAVSFGKELPDGSIADKNYVWLSQWQLQNINDHHQLPIDLDTYRQLKYYIAKALVPLLQIWLYATRDDGVFEKRYDELCQILNIRRWTYFSKIKEKLGPSLDELTKFGYLAGWRIEHTSDNQGYKILFFHGEKFHRDRRARQSRKTIATGNSERQGSTSTTAEASHRESEQTPSYRLPVSVAQPALPMFDPALVAEFTTRGITEERAIALLANVKPGRDVVAQLEHAEDSVKNSKIEIRNPAAYIARLIELNTPVPDGFETRAQRQARKERERKESAEREAKEAEEQLEWDYESYRASEIDRYIQANPEAFEAVKEAKWKADRERFSFSTESMAVISARHEISKVVSFLTFEEFLDRKQHNPDFFLKPVAVSLDAEPATVAADSAAQETVMTDDVAVSPDGTPTEEEVVDISPIPPLTAEEKGATIQREPQSPAGPAIPKPVIEFVSGPPPQEPGGNATEMGVV